MIQACFLNTTILSFTDWQFLIHSPHNKQMKEIYDEKSDSREPCIHDLNLSCDVWPHTKHCQGRRNVKQNVDNNKLQIKSISDFFRYLKQKVSSFNNLFFFKTSVQDF